MNERAQRVLAARGKLPLDLLIEGAQLVNVFTGEIYPADIGIAGGYVAHAGEPGWSGCEPRQRLNAEGRFAVPGLVDTHVHIESSMLSPTEFAAAVVPRGTTTVVIDPHEIGNVLGMRGVRYMLEASSGLPLRVYAQVPSCVPAVPALEAAGADFGPREIAQMLTWERVIGLAEVMDYVGVVQQTERMTDILDAARAADTVLSGHSPGVRGRDLAAYLMAGPDSDHEALDQAELLEKLRIGMTVEGRVSSFSDNMPALGRIVCQLGTVPPNLVMCTDDIFPEDLARNGHMDWVLRSAISAGISPVQAVRAATLQGAQRHRLREVGAIAPGKRADIVLTRSLDAFRAEKVFVAGELVACAGRMTVELPAEPHTLENENTVHLPHPPRREDFQVAARPGHASETVRVMRVRFSDWRRLLETVEMPVVDGILDVAAVGGVCLACVLERHGRSGRSGFALVAGLGLRRGAVASTVAHDSHNLLVIGCNPDDMALAARQLAACGGGICCTEGGRVLALLALPIAGLMSPLPLAELVPVVETVSAALRGLGIQMDQPIAAIIGMALPVIPDYGVTDMGLVDVGRQCVIPLWADAE